MSGWITADGTPEPSSSNLYEGDKASAQTTPEGSRGVSREARIPFNGGPGTVVEYRNGEYQAGVDHGYQGSVIGSARTEGGGVIVDRAPTAKDRVTLPGGMTTSISAAVLSGFLVRNPDGSFADAQPAEALKNPAEVVAQAAPTAPAEGSLEATATADPTFNIGEEGEAAMAAIAQSVQPGDAIKAMDEVLQLGEVSENTVARMASQAGIEPEQMLEQITAAHQGFYDGAMARFEAAGIDAEALEAFVKDNPQALSKLAQGARNLVMHNNTTQMDEVQEAFFEQADRYMPEEVTRHASSPPTWSLGASAHVRA